MNKLPESHYSINKLHIIFAFVAIGLLGALGAIIDKDYNREWKKYQKQYEEFEIESTRVKQDLASKELEQNEEYKILLEDLNKATETFKESCSNYDELQEQIASLEDDKALIDQDLKILKSSVNELKYAFEHDVAHMKEGDDYPVETKRELQATEIKVTQLNLDKEKIDEQIQEITSRTEECRNQLADLERQQRSFEREVTILNRKLDSIDPAEMTIKNQFAQLLRNLPLLELANPSYKIEQIVLDDITDDLNINQVPKVERCITCHKGITNPDFANAPQPLTTHPNLEMYVSNESAHPIEEFGCTVCHGGRGRGTTFNSTAHTPNDDEQKKAWKEKYDWHPIHHWDHPMLPIKYTEASCFKCHSGQNTIPGAEKLNLGLNIIERTGCYSCHMIDRYKDWPKPGPDLTKIAAKMDRDFTFKWIERPQNFRHNTWMPAYFHQSNNSDHISKERGFQEIHAMTEYLFAESTAHDLKPVPYQGDVERGKELVKSIGCYGCHQQLKDPANEPEITTRQQLYREHGPNLIGLGSKVTPEWLFDWLKDPSRYHPETQMPSLRLSDQEAADITAYLLLDRVDNFEKLEVPKINDKVLDELTLEYLMRTQTKNQAMDKLAAMSQQEKLYMTGKETIGKYGCYSCHNISGFDDRKPIGIALTYKSDTPLNKFDFGFVHNIEHTKQAWYEVKLANPRIFDLHKVKKWNEKSMMPNPYLKDNEIEAVVTALLGFVDPKTVEKKLYPRTPENLFIEEGQALIKQLNCQGCHLIEGDGEAIKNTIENWLVEYKEKSKKDAEDLATHFGPPNLKGAGAKLKADWLYNFLHDVEPVRPWLSARMPSYKFNGHHLNVLVKYFNYLDQEQFPFEDIVDTSLTPEQYKAGETLISSEIFGCNQCHFIGDEKPTGDKEVWAPNFALTKHRLKPDWIIDWLVNPQDVMPGTKMPTYYDPGSFDESGPPDILDGDEHEQIRVMRNYLNSISDHYSEDEVYEINRAAQEGKPLPKKKTKTTTQSTQQAPTPLPATN